jgi:hypothetical protein
VDVGGYSKGLGYCVVTLDMYDLNDADIRQLTPQRVIRRIRNLIDELDSVHPTRADVLHHVLRSRAAGKQESGHRRRNDSSNLGDQSVGDRAWTTRHLGDQTDRRCAE